MANKRFNAPFSFNGFIDRTEWIISVLLFWGYYHLVVLGVALEEYNTFFMYIFLIPAYWFFFAQGVKRCHDRGNSGWNILIPFYWVWLMIAGTDREGGDMSIKECEEKSDCQNDDEAKEEEEIEEVPVDFFKNNRFEL